MRKARSCMTVLWMAVILAAMVLGPGCVVIEDFITPYSLLIAVNEFDHTYFFKELLQSVSSLTGALDISTVATQLEGRVTGGEGAGLGGL